MVNDQLLGYIKNELSLNVSKDIIIANLKSQGWSDGDISEAFTALSIPMVSEASIIEPNIQQEQPAVSNLASLTASPIHRNKKVFLIVGVILFLFLAVGGAYAYYSGMFISSATFTSNLINNVRNANSVTYDTTINIDSSEVEDKPSETAQMIPNDVFPKVFTVTLKGAYDFLDTENKKVSSVIAFDSSSFSLGTEFRLVDNTFYAEVTKLPNLDFLASFKEFENKWFSYSYKTEDGKTVSSPLTSLSGIDPEVVDSITTEQKEQFYQITKDARFFKITKRLLPEKVNGSLSYHFIFDLDREGIQAYSEAVNAYFKTIYPENAEFSMLDSTSVLENLNAIENFKGEVWIGRRDTLPYKITLDFTIKPEVEREERAKINIISVFSDWNKPGTIVAPTESISFEELFSGIMSSSMGPVEENKKTKKE